MRIIPLHVIILAVALCSACASTSKGSAQAPKPVAVNQAIAHADAVTPSVRSKEEIDGIIDEETRQHPEYNDPIGGDEEEEETPAISKAQGPPQESAPSGGWRKAPISEREIVDAIAGHPCSTCPAQVQQQPQAVQVPVQQQPQIQPQVVYIQVPPAQPQVVYVQAPAPVYARPASYGAYSQVEIPPAPGPIYNPQVQQPQYNPTPQASYFQVSYPQQSPQYQQRGYSNGQGYSRPYYSEQKILNKQSGI